MSMWCDCDCCKFFSSCDWPEKIYDDGCECGVPKNEDEAMEQMAEYIVKIDHPELCVEYGGTNSTDRLERIVRCRDCRRWNGIENALGQRVCERSGKFCKPNGFCAWGEVE